MSSDIIDPAWEIGGVIRELLLQGPSSEPTWKIFHKALGKSASPSEHWELMSALQARLIRFDQFVRSIEDPELDDQLRTRIVSAIETFNNALRPEQQTQQWQHTFQNFVRSDDALQLTWFSIVAKRHRPLRRLTNDERTKLIDKITEAVAAIESGNDIPQWAKLPLGEGLRRLKFTLQHLVLFGTEHAIDQLLDIYHKTEAIEAAVVKASGASTPNKGSTLLTVLNCLVLAANLFWIPDQATTAFERYQGWYLKTIVENPELPKPETLLLAPPVPTDDSLGNAESPAAVEPKTPSESNGDGND